MKTLALPVAILGFLLSTSAQAAWVKPTLVTASSSLAPSDGVTYEVTNLTDGKASNIWVEGEEGSGLGSWVQLDFGSEKVIDSFTLWNGNWYSWDFWQRHNRPKDIEVYLADGTMQSFTLQDVKTPETIRFPSAVRTTSLKIKIKEVYRGTTYNDTCISEIQVNDSSPTPWNLPGGGSDSGHLEEDGDGTYTISNTYDGLLDTMWCENQKTGDGTGSWVEYLFGRSVPVSSLILRNGNTYSLPFWMKSNRATAAQLRFSDGTTQDIVIRDSMTEQTIPFATHNTSSVRITFNTVVRAKTSTTDPTAKVFNDLCISEARFNP